MHHVVAFLLVLIFLMMLIMLVLIAGGAPLITVLFGLISIFVILVFIWIIMKYSATLRPEPITERPEHPLPLVGGLCEVLEEVTPTKGGYVRYRGELWKAFSIRSTFKKGDYAYIIDVRGRFLIIEREPPHVIREFSRRLEWQG